MTPSQWSFAVRVCIFFVAFVAGSAPAQDLLWRTDYNQARKESTEKNRPMFIDFVTDNCYWCKKLDSGPFRETAVVKLLSEQFVLLKVDAERTPQLADALKIQSYPTMIIASSDGRILTIIEGFVEAPKLLEQLRKAAGSHAPAPQWMVRDFQEAEKALKDGNHARAIALIKPIVGSKEVAALQDPARVMLTGIEQQAASGVAKAKMHEEKGQLLEATDALAQVQIQFPGSRAHEEAGSLLSTLTARPEWKIQQRARRARELLALAREDFRTQQFAGALEKSDLIAAGYSELPEAMDAARIAADIRANPEHLAKACSHLQDRLSQTYIALADSWIKKGNMEEATTCLERIQREFPGSMHAQVAAVKLKELQGLPAVQSDFKKQR
jgi:thioredoxin-like negative regulator of GroEL